ncbi:MAG: 5'-3' exonuclease H3TH domain-containing protein [Pseudomonadales bacterium]
MSSSVYLVDASIYIFRAYFSLPDDWHHPNGQPLNAVYGYGRWLAGLLAREQPAYIAAAFDESLGSCFRNDLYAAYKESRQLPDEALAFQLKLCQQMTSILGVTTLASERYEADDLIASLARVARQQEMPVRVISADKDLAQVVRKPCDSQWDYGRKEEQSQSALMTHLGIAPQRMDQLLALTGDSSDDIPGIPGVGIKTAVAMLALVDNLQQLLDQPQLLENSGIRGAKTLVSKLEQYREQVMLAWSLTRLCDTAPTDINLNQLRWTGPTDEAADFFQSNGLRALLPQFYRTGLLTKK